MPVAAEPPLAPDRLAALGAQRLARVVAGVQQVGRGAVDTAGGTRQRRDGVVAGPGLIAAGRVAIG
jgi:hypothetical protein